MLAEGIDGAEGLLHGLLALLALLAAPVATAKHTAAALRMRPVQALRA